MVNENFIKKFKYVLNNGIIIFLYKKKNGEIRRAIGTTHPSIIPASLTFHNKNNKFYHKKITDLINYYDIEKKEWRSFYLSNLEKTISIVFVKKENQPSTYHITEEDRRLAQINNEIIEIEKQRMKYKNEMRKLKNRKSYSKKIKEIEKNRKILNEKMKNLKGERESILIKKDNRNKMTQQTNIFS